MAEMLIVVGIIAVLGGVSVVAVVNYQRGAAQTERDAIAREIFVAAQNHLTMADSQGYLGLDTAGDADFGTREASDSDIFYYIVNGQSSFAAANSGALNLMLPFASVDETVRTGGSYIIRYHRDTAMVTDVFYTVPTGRYRYTLGADDYDTAFGLRGKENAGARRNCGALKTGNQNSVLGWYGGDIDLETGGTIQPPTIEVRNREKLTVNLTDPNYDNASAALKLILVGGTSGAMAAIDKTSTRFTDNTAGSYEIVLDDITRAQRHFNDLNSETGGIQFQPGAKFIPGEDITVSAVSYSTTALTNIAYGSEQTVNSLFADIQNVGNATVLIGNFRHLENLDYRVSNLDNTVRELDLDAKQNELKVATAMQIADLSDPAPTPAPTEPVTPLPTEPDLDLDGGDSGAETANDKLSWTGFLTETGGTNIYRAVEDQGVSKDGCCWPVTPPDGLVYDGQGHSVSGVKVDAAEAAGLFGAVNLGSISNLKLIDFSVTATGDSIPAGALAGSTNGADITNVVAVNSTDRRSPADVSAEGSAGGLIGSVTGGTLDHCAAALTVSGKDAGGLIGSATGSATIDYSYSGGHTSHGSYMDGDTPIINVTGAENAGGLVGSAGNTTIKNSYSTCSVSGATAGGLLGSGTGDIKNCYAVGLVEGATEGATKGAFAGNHTTGSIDDCMIYAAVNEGMTALGDGTEGAITALDADAKSYEAFINGPDTWNDAVVYDADVGTIYGNKFNLRTVDQLGRTDKEVATEEEKANFAAIHYGDWPTPEIFVFNTPADGAEP